MALFDDEYMVSDAQGAAPVSPLVAAPPEAQAPGIGLGDVQAPAPVADASPIPPLSRREIQLDLRKEAIGKMGGLEKVLTAFAEFGAGVQGRKSPLDTRLAQQQQEKLQKLQEFKIHTDALQDGVKMAQKLRGEARTQFIENYATQLDGVRPGLGDTYRSLSKQPDMGAVLAKYSANSPTLKRALELDPTGEAALKLLSSPDAMKTINGEIDSSVMPTLLKKGQTFKMGWQQLVPSEMADKFNKDGQITASELMEANEWIKANKPDMAKALSFSDEDLQIIGRNQEAFYATLGIVSPKTEQELIKDRAKNPAESEIGKIRADEKSGRVTKAEADARIAKLNKQGEGITINMPGSSDTVQGEDGKFYKFRIGKDGKVDAVPMQTPSGGALRPPKTASEIKADKDRGGEEATISSVRGRIKAMSDQLQSNAGIVGPAGVARRIGESAAGVVAPGVDTPALDYQNNVRLLVADVRKIVEKDPNLSNQERENLYEMLGGGVLQTPGSAVRALNNVMGYVEGKSTHGKTREANIESSVKAAGWDFEPSKYDYRVVDGKVQRKAKGGK